MAKAIILALTCTVILSLSLSAKTIDSGWKMYGFDSDIDVASTFNDKPIVTIWGYDTLNQKWKAYSPDSSIQNLLNSQSDISLLETLDVGNGVWINALSSFSIDSIDGNVSQLQRDLASIIASSASSLGTTGDVAKSSTQSTSTTISGLNNSLPTLGRTLASYTIPDFTVDGDFFSTSISNVIDGKSAKATIGFYDNDTLLNASNVLDTSGVAYGFSTENISTLSSLESFFTSLSTLSTIEQYQAVTNMIPKIEAIKQAPLFSYVGNENFQDFFNSFPSTESEAMATNWEALGTLANSIDYSSIAPNFTSIDAYLEVSISEIINVGGYQVEIPTLKTKESIETFMTTPLELTFKGDGNGTITATDMTINMSNIELNVTYDTSSSNIIGSYDLSIDAEDGSTYKASPTFDENGCLGANVYKDEESEPIARMKVFDDGLYIVNENNQKIEKVQ